MDNNIFIINNHSAAEIYASAWNELKADKIIMCLSEDCTYTSQWVFEEMKGKSRLTDYFVQKMDLIAKGDSIVRAKPYLITYGPEIGNSCVILTQYGGGNNVNQVAILIKVDDGEMVEIDIIHPALVGYEDS